MSANKYIFHFGNLGKPELQLNSSWLQNTDRKIQVYSSVITVIMAIVAFVLYSLDANPDISVDIMDGMWALILTEVLIIGRSLLWVYDNWKTEWKYSILLIAIALNIILFNLFCLIYSVEIFKPLGLADTITEEIQLNVQFSVFSLLLIPVAYVSRQTVRTAMAEDWKMLKSLKSDQKSWLTWIVIIGVVAFGIVFIILYLLYPRDEINIGGTMVMVMRTYDIQLSLFWILLPIVIIIAVVVSFIVPKEGRIGRGTIAIILAIVIGVMILLEIYEIFPRYHIQEFNWFWTALTFGAAIDVVLMIYYGNKKNLGFEVAKDMKALDTLVSFIAFVIAIIIVGIVISSSIQTLDMMMYGSNLARIAVFEAQGGINYFSYVFYILLMSPSAAVMIGFMVFGAVTVMVSQNIAGVGRIIGGFATGVVVIIPMLFCISIFTGGIEAPEILIDMLGSGVAQFVFGLAEVSVFILMVSIIGVFIAAGRMLGGIATGGSSN